MGWEIKYKPENVGGSGRIRTHEIGTSYHTSFQVMAVMTASVRYHLVAGGGFEHSDLQLMRLTS